METTMRVLAGALLAMLATGPDALGAGSLAVTLDTRPLAGSCAVVSRATIVAYDARSRRVVAYRFVRSDGTASPTGRLTLRGDGAVAQSVAARWTPHGPAPWVALEILAPERMRSQRTAAVAHCANRDLAATR
jgi:hypothetical protein